MKKATAILVSIAVIAVLCFQVYAANPVKAPEEWLTDWDERTSPSGKVWLTPGEDGNDINITWLSKGCGSSMEYRDKDDPSWKKAEVSSMLSVFGYINTAELNDLPAGDYEYKFTADKKEYTDKSFSVSGRENGFKVMFCSDPQLGRSDSNSVESVENDCYGWERTLQAAKDMGTELILCGGDQVNDGFSPMQFNAFLSPDILSEIPIATATGNHEFMSVMQSLFFKDTGVNEIGNDYYFSYGNALFIVLDSNNIVKSVHEKTIADAIHSFPDATFRIIMLHHSAYGADTDEIGNAIGGRILTDLYDKYDIDLVLSGHDHYYSRTRPVLAGNESPEGTVYFEAGSASGGKCNHFDPSDNPFIEFHTDLSVASYSVMTFTEDSIKVSSYITDTGEEFDSFTVVPADKAPDIPAFGILSTIKAFFEYILSYIPVMLKNIAE